MNCSFVSYFRFISLADYKICRLCTQSVVALIPISCFGALFNYNANYGYYRNAPPYGIHISRNSLHKSWRRQQQGSLGGNEETGAPNLCFDALRTDTDKMPMKKGKRGKKGKKKGKSSTKKATKGSKEPMAPDYVPPPPKPLERVCNVQILVGEPVKYRVLR